MALKIGSKQRVWLFKTLGVLLIAGCFVGVDILILRHLLEIRSSNGFINGSLNEVQAPAAGFLSLRQWEVGQRVVPNTRLGVITPDANSVNVGQPDIELESPSSGIVYELDRKSGDYVHPGIGVMKVLDCQKLWVDTFVREKDIPNLDPEKPVSIRILTDSEKRWLTGKVKFVRHGVRQGVRQALLADASGNDEWQKSLLESASPQPIIQLTPLTRQQPSLTLVRVQLDKPPPSDKNNFCYVGSRVETVFKRK